MAASERPSARFVKPGEMLAMHRSALHQGPQGFFWMFGGGTKGNERVHDVAIVHVRDALEHHADAWGDNYESILLRVEAAMTGADEVDRHKQKQKQHKWDHYADRSYEPLPDIEATPPAAVVLCIDSPGGVVSGLNETVFALQRLKEKTGVRLVAYVNEMAASAAYALACACDEIIAPPSAIVGSIGVISTMVSQARKNAKDGIDVELITSGDRKADGHLHAPISDDAVGAERNRVMKLARAFWSLASKARKLSMAEVSGFQAGIFLGTEAESRGLVDEIASYDEALLALSAETADAFTGPSTKKALDVGTNSSSLRHNAAHSGPKRATEKDSPMLKLVALIKKTEAALAKETDPKKLLALAADLEAYKKVEKHVEHTKSEEDDDPEDDEDDDKKKDDDEDDEDEKKSSKKESSKKEEKKEEAKAEDDDEEEAKAVLALARAATGKIGRGVYGALAAKLELANLVPELRARVSKIEKSARRDERSGLIADAIRQNRVTEAMVERAGLKTRKLEDVKSFLDMFPTALIKTADGDLLVPKPGSVSPGGAPFPTDVSKAIEAAIDAAPNGIDKAKLREKLELAHRQAQAKTVNGVGY